EDPFAFVVCTCRAGAGLQDCAAARTRRTRGVCRFGFSGSGWTRDQRDSDGCIQRLGRGGGASYLGERTDDGGGRSRRRAIHRVEFRVVFKRTYQSSKGGLARRKNEAAGFGQRRVHPVTVGSVEERGSYVLVPTYRRLSSLRRFCRAHKQQMRAERFVC